MIRSVYFASQPHLTNPQKINKLYFSTNKQRFSLNKDITRPLRMQVYTLLLEQREISLLGKSMIQDLDDLELEILALEAEMNWLNFIDYCNTSAWSYRC